MNARGHSTGYGVANGAAASEDLSRANSSTRSWNGTMRCVERDNPIVQQICGDDPRLAVIEPGEGDLGASVDEGY
jgi:hypothetical protein